MNSHILSWLPLLSLLKILILVQLPPSSSNPQVYADCSTAFNCGNITGIHYPFRGNGDPAYCGYPGLELNCDQTNLTTIMIANMEYRVLGIDQTTQIMRIAREDMMESTCPRDLVNTTLDYNIFDYASNYMNLTFIYGCPISNNDYHFSCGNNGVYVLPGAQGPGRCNVSVVVPVIQMSSGESGNFTGLDQALREGFEVRLKVNKRACSECTGSGGRCGYDYAVNQTTCFCPDPPYVGLGTCLVARGAPWDSTRLPDDDQYIACGELFECANIPNIGYPFWGGNRPEFCGHAGFQLSNCGGDVPLITIQSRSYRVMGIDYSTRSLTVAREDLWNTTCINYLYNTTLDPTPFSFAPTNINVSLHYACTQIPVQMPQQFPSQFNCYLNGTDSVNYFTRGVSSINTELGTCNHTVIVPVNERWGQALGSIPASIVDLTAALASGFGLEWVANETRCQRCETSGGRCGSNSTSFACYCSDQSYPLNCAPSNNRSTNQLQIVLPVVGAILAGIGIGWLIFFCRQRRKRLAAESSKTENKDLETTPSSKGLTTTTTTTNFTRSISSYPSTTEFGKGSTYFGVQVFNYTELEEATDNFDTSRELGEGGFGTVYYAKLPDGREVAVKRLYENNFKRVEQFMNEVEILTRLQHQYLVKLYGCTSKRSRELLLVYEYISNGTVGDHLHGKQATSGRLSWPVRLNIAVETAEALTYLHASDIIHRDVKTNNILLDDSLRVKVADFGLSRLFPNDVTHVSTAPQGTPGYVDPEYYQCYQLTDKSDVYSFGVVLIELISSLQAVDTNRHRHDINLANMAINKIQNHGLSELVDMSLGFEMDSSVRRMITLVAELAFRCLQQEKDLRPSMKEVLDTLRGIQNEESSAQKAEVVDILVDDGLLLNGNNPSPPSPDFMVTEKLISSSAPNSTG